MGYLIRLGHLAREPQEFPLPSPEIIGVCYHTQLFLSVWKWKWPTCLGGKTLPTELSFHLSVSVFMDPAIVIRYADKPWPQLHLCFTVSAHSPTVALAWLETLWVLRTRVCLGSPSSFSFPQRKQISMGTLLWFLKCRDRCLFKWN